MWYGTPDEAWAHSQIVLYDRIPSWPTVSVARFSGKKSRMVTFAVRLPRRRLPTLRQTERRQGGSIDCRSDRQSMVSLKSCQRLPRFRSENSIDLSDVITVTLQLDLHVHDDLVGRQIAVTVNWPVIRIVSVRIVPPGRIPITRIPVPPPAAHKDDARVVISPPAAVMPSPVVIVKRGVV